MKVFSSFLCLLSSFTLWAQFEVKGKIIGYPFGQITIKKYNGPYKEILTEALSDQKGDFKVKIEPYEGVLIIELPKIKKSFSMFSDAKKIDFEVNIDHLNDIKYLDSDINKAAIIITRNHAKIEILKKPMELYTSFDYPYGFYNCIQRELYSLEMKVQKLLKKNPLLKYNFYLEKIIIKINKILKNSKNSITHDLIEQKEKILEILKEDGPYLESSGKLISLLLQHIKLSQLIYNTDKEVKEDLNNSLNQIGYNTARAQQILLGVIDVLGEDFLDFFISKLKYSKYEISSILKEKFQTYENLKIGKIAPEIVFENLINGQFNKLSEVPSMHIILFFWTSSCDYCKEAITKINEKYNSLKRRDIEIIGILLDEDKENFLNQIPNRKWYNHRANSGEIQKIYDISSTPTFYLLDRKKQIMLKSHDFEKIIYKIRQ